MPNTFVLTRNHIAILRAMNWQWSDLDSGGPMVDGKRPFGFSSGIERDIYALVNDLDDEDETVLDDEVKEEMMILYRECQTALMVILSAESFATGLYVKDGENDEWELVSDLVEEQVYGL
jgi:hypothetical protein